MRSAQLRAHRAVNTELVGLYWRIGHAILERQDSEGWGAKVIDRLAADLHGAFPDQSGLSTRNLRYMRSFARAWPEPMLQQAVAQLPWGHITVLLDRLDGRELRDWYAGQAVEHGWSRAVLANMVASRLHDRIGTASTNFAEQLAPDDGELARPAGPGSVQLRVPRPDRPGR